MIQRQHTSRFSLRTIGFALLLLWLSTNVGCALFQSEPEPKKPATMQEFLKQKRPGDKMSG